MHSHAIHLHNFNSGLQPLADHALIKMVRSAEPDNNPWRGPISGGGEMLNLTSKAQDFMVGLEGVTQGSNNMFAVISLITFLGLLGFTLLYRWIHMANTHLRHIVTMGKWIDQRYWMYNHTRIWPWIKNNIIYAPLFRQRHNKEIQLTKAISVGTLPSRFHTILLFLYLASNVAYCCTLNYGDKNVYALWAQIRGRTGWMSAFNVIPTVLFALRNNPLISILGVSYDTFNLLHRWCARMMVAEAIAHTVAWAVNASASGGIYQLHISLSTSVSFTWGMVSTCAFTAMVIFASSPIRHGWYEIFLNSHRLLAGLGIAGLYIHLQLALPGGLPQVPYMQLVCALWVGEWVWRSGRIMYHNVSRQKGITRVTVEALPAEAVRVTFDLSRPWHWKPGCHVHAYLPRYSLWSSHPFSVAWAENRTRDGLPPALDAEKGGINSHSQIGSMIFYGDDKRPGLQTRPSTFSKGSAGATIAAVSEKTHKAESTNIAIPHESGCTSVSLIMRARTGLTRTLYNKASKSPSGTITTWGALEGPYGGHEAMTSYGTVILFAGGVGITHCVGYVHHLMKHYQAGTSSTQKILLVWSVPNTEALEWVRIWMDKILRMEGRRDVLRIQLFVTKPRHRGEVVSNTGSVQMFPGRCNPHTVMEKEMQERIGAVGVTICGPGAFADSVRSAVRGVVEQGSVDFVEEAFTY